MLFHQQAEQAVVVEPSGFGLFEMREFPGMARIGTIELRPGKFEQSAFDSPHRRVIHPRRVERGAQAVAGLRNFRGTETRDLGGVERQIDRIERDRGNGTVGALIRAVFVDREQLDETDAVIRSPVDPFAHGTRVADAEVTLAAWGKGGDQDAGLALSGWVHGGTLAGPASA